ncbi:hypothetical protein [Psychromonas antarctica]|jgi:hypothetical protein|uniref:hypothetical protein n=1 Tax=Psychromonas antarctica TaxID=67573 RepID=UPI001EE7CD94|nr:hypothetical protein [Psychromonas antarctica]MCG6199714.1 hypothetical protein [Psychromonas antarctica]
MFTNTTKHSFVPTDKTQKKIQSELTTSVNNTLLANRIPASVTDKLSNQVVTNIDLLMLYKIIAQDIQDQRFPKQRILDRTIVHMFEILYRIINTQDENRNKANVNEFFSIVPRGECLDLFLQLVKEYCMGDEEIERHTYKMGPLIEAYRNDTIINWYELYKSEQFKDYLTGLLTLILTHLREDPKPIPALENKIPIRYQPYRINSFLNQICKLKQTGLLSL